MVFHTYHHACFTGNTCLLLKNLRCGQRFYHIVSLFIADKPLSITLTQLLNNCILNSLTVSNKAGSDIFMVCFARFQRGNIDGKKNTQKAQTTLHCPLRQNPTKYKNKIKEEISQAA